MNHRTPVLLCFDGSHDAAAAIERAGQLLGPRDAVVVTVWEPVATWEPYDPATILSAPLSRLASEAVGLDDITREVADDKVKDGMSRARGAGFAATGRLVGGKPWKAICEVADELDAEAVVVGARGLSRVKSALLGSVSAAVVAHSARPVLVVPRTATVEHVAP